MHPIILALILVAAVSIVAILMDRRRTQKAKGVLAAPAAEQSAIEKQFKTVFFNKTPADRERILNYWMTKGKCGRDEAMKRAIEDVQRG